MTIIRVWVQKYLETLARGRTNFRGEHDKTPRERDIQTSLIFNNKHIVNNFEGTFFSNLKEVRNNKEKEITQAPIIAKNYVP